MTDHDRLEESLDGLVIHRGDVEVVTGAEARADVAHTKVKILGYYLKPTTGSLRAAADSRRAL